jgi:fumarylacetoacetate (FAA) hydrolase
MRLATFRDGSRDGRLSLVRQDGTRLADASHIARNLQAALDDWDSIEPLLREMDAELENGRIATGPLLLHQLQAPLPRAYEWVDGSAYLNHVRLVRKARGAEMPASFETDPLVYQGGSGVMLGPADDIVLPDPLMGISRERSPSSWATSPWERAPTTRSPTSGSSPS